MRFSNLIRPLFAIILLFSCCTPAAQKTDSPSSQVVSGGWKKLVTRDVDMDEKEDTVTHHLRDQNGDTVLFQMLVNAIKSGKITAYNNIGGFFTNKLQPDELKAMLEPRADTVVVTDPVTGNQMVTAAPSDFKYNAIHKYRVLEEWEFDPATGKTEVQITGIAPVMDLYSENLSGVQHAVFWLKYEDVRNILSQYEQLHPDNTLASHIWHDYFQSDVKPVIQK